MAHRTTPARSRARLAAPLLAFATLAAAACSSFNVEVAAAQSDAAAKNVRSLYVVVGPDSVLGAVIQLTDPLDLLNPKQQTECYAVMQFAPVLERGALAWKTVTNKQVRAGVAEVKDLSPLKFVVKSGALKSYPTTSAVVIALFQDDRRAKVLFATPQIETKDSFVIDVRDGELVLR
jgi:hypothetical protein